MLRKIKKIVVLYHKGCRDGFGAAWAAWKKFGSRAEYIPIGHEEPPLKLKNKEIYMLDITYATPVLKKLMRENERVTSIDHHVSAEKATKLTKDYSYAVNHSGAVLAWRYFHREEKDPMLLRYIEDGDIWKWKISKSKEILNFVGLSDFNFLVWDRMARDLEKLKKRKAYIEKGALLLKYADSLVSYLLPSAEKVKFAGYTTYAINAPRYFASDLGNILATKLPPLAIVWREEAGRVKVSLRSNGKADVSKIAQRFGGGGHKAAAFFSFQAGKTFPWKIILRSR